MSSLVAAVGGTAGVVGGYIAGSAPTELDAFAAASFLTYDANAESYANNDPVSTATDQGPSGRNATQATAGFRPLWIASGVNSNPVYRFDGTDDYLQTASFTANAVPNTIIVAAKIFNSGTEMIVDGIGSSNRHVVFTSSGQYRANAGSTLVRSGATGAAWHIYVAVFNGASSRLYLDGGTATTGNTGTQSLTGITLGVDYTITSKLRGDIQWMGMYDGNLYTADLALLNGVGTELATRLGITWTTIT